MKKLMWLIRREYWENKLMLLWVNTGAALLIVAANVVSRNMHGRHIEPIGMTAAKMQMILGADVIITFIPQLVLLFMLLPFMVGVYCLGSLFNERDDRSMLFWKSMPVSGVGTILSKVVFALLIFPLVTLVISLVADALMLLNLVIRWKIEGVQSNIFSVIFSTPDLILQPLKMILLLPVYILWALPTVGWLILVSAWAKTKPVLWAICVPIISVWLMDMVNKNMGLDWNIRWLIFNFVGRGLLSIIPGSWDAYEKLDDLKVDYNLTFQGWPIDVSFESSLNMLGTSELWGGVVTGIAMLGVALFLRQKKDAI